MTLLPAFENPVETQGNHFPMSTKFYSFLIYSSRFIWSPRGWFQIHQLTQRKEP